jgi:hypothetical protein
MQEACKHSILQAFNLFVLIFAEREGLLTLIELTAFQILGAL